MSSNIRNISTSGLIFSKFQLLPKWMLDNLCGLNFSKLNTISNSIVNFDEHNKLHFSIIFILRTFADKFKGHNEG